MKFSARAVRVKGKGRLRAASTAAWMRSTAWDRGYSGASRLPLESSMEPPTAPDSAASRIVYAHVVELGGSISAEHGIGQMKRDMLAELDSPARLAALRAIKTGLDPAGLFNPGKLIG